MNKKVIALMVSILGYEASPVFATQINTNDGGIDVDVWHSRRVENANNNTCTTEWYTEKEHVYPFHSDKLTMSEEMFESLASTGFYKKGFYRYTVDDIEYTKDALAFYRENQNDQGELASQYHKKWLENNFAIYKKGKENKHIFLEAYPDMNVEGRVNFRYEMGQRNYTGSKITMADMEKDYPNPKPVKFKYCLSETLPPEQNTVDHVLLRTINVNDSDFPIGTYRVKIKQGILTQVIRMGTNNNGPVTLNSGFSEPEISHRWLIDNESVMEIRNPFPITVHVEFKDTAAYLNHLVSAQEVSLFVDADLIETFNYNLQNNLHSFRFSIPPETDATVKFIAPHAHSPSAVAPEGQGDLRLLSIALSDMIYS